MSIIKEIIKWLISLTVWMSLVYIFIGVINSYINTGMIVWLVFGMILYWYMVLRSSNFKYFMRQTDARKIYEQMDQQFKNPPRITMKIECYHYQTKTTKHQCYTSTKTIGDRIVTHTTYEVFTYTSWRDVSGLFRLDISKTSRDRPFVKLKLATDVTFVNDGTDDDFSTARSRFKHANERDQHQDYSEELTVDGFNRNFMVRVTDVMPYCVRPLHFLFWCLLTFYMPYKIYVNLYCSRQHFKLRKVVSSRQDLNAGEIMRKLAYYYPRILTRKQLITFSPSQPPQYTPVEPSAVGPDGIPSGEPPTPDATYFVAPSPATAQPGPNGYSVVNNNMGSVPIPPAGYVTQLPAPTPVANPQPSVNYGPPANGSLRNQNILIGQQPQAVATPQGACTIQMSAVQIELTQQQPVPPGEATTKLSVPPPPQEPAQTQMVSPPNIPNPPVVPPIK